MIVCKSAIKPGMIYSDPAVTVNNDGSVNIECGYEKVMGLGERFSRIDQKGHTVSNEVEEKFCNQGEKTYFPIPFFMLDNGYGFFLDTRKVLSFDFTEGIRISGSLSAADILYIFKGSYREIISDFIEITGRNKKAPKWTFGPWISAHRWNSRKLVDEVREKLKEYDIPVTVMVLEQWSDEATFYIFNKAEYPDREYLDYQDFTFDKSPWDNPRDMVKDLHDDGICILLWQCPVVKHIPEDEEYNKRHEADCRLAAERKFVVQSEESVYRIPEGNWFNGSMIPDFTNEAAVEWWFRNRKYLLDIGIDGFKTDGGEFIHGKALNSIGETEAELKNNYALEYVKAYSDFVGKDRVIFSRAGYTGQQQYSLQWAGDQKSTFEELQAVYRAGISSSLCGQVNWGFDIAGFSGELPSLELYYRATQLAVFTPIMQVHSEPVGGQFSAVDPIRKFNNERTVWNIAGGDQKVMADMRGLYNLRMNLLPYIYSEYLKAIEAKTTLMKHMNIDYSGNYPEEQYLFGRLIVAPVLSQGQGTQDIILPEGRFHDIFSDEQLENNISLTVADLSEIHAYIGDGTALVSRKQELVPESIDNGLDYEELYFRLYGDRGSYHYVDDNNDFTVCWIGDVVSFDGKKNIEVNCIFIR